MNRIIRSNQLMQPAVYKQGQHTGSALSRLYSLAINPHLTPLRM